MQDWPRCTWIRTILAVMDHFLVLFFCVNIAKVDIKKCHKNQWAFVQKLQFYCFWNGPEGEACLLLSLKPLIFCNCNVPKKIARTKTTSQRRASERWAFQSWPWINFWGAAQGGAGASWVPLKSCEWSGIGRLKSRSKAQKPQSRGQKFEIRASYKTNTHMVSSEVKSPPVTRH